MNSNNPSKRRVVITGMGVVAPNGQDLNTFWTTVRDGKSASAPVSRFDASKLTVKIAAEVKDFDLNRFLKGGRAGRYDLCVQFGLAAALAAARDSGLELNGLNPDRTGVVEGTTLSGMASIVAGQISYMQKGMRAIHPYHIVAGYTGEGSSTVGMHLGIRGHAVTYCTGCSAGTDAIGYGSQLIQWDDMDVVLAGAAEEIVELAHASFARLGAMTELDVPPTEAMCPFDRRRDGFVLGEGGAYVVLEELSHALTRGAKIYGELVGYGTSCEAFHATDPHPKGLGFQLAMQKAMHNARLRPEEIDYINAHASATPLNDATETTAIKEVFKDAAPRLAIGGTKPITGHSMGAVGAVEAVICALALDHQTIPPTINLVEPDDECDLDYVPNEARDYPLRTVMNVSAGFGGRYASLIMKRY